ncbi:MULTISPECIES: HlyD family secretion protein [Bacillaceae]|uniref:HlyD family secretion protein n=3 Tax=Bacillales TaxID=1385 RepID=UPI000BF6D138|nr:MULTISPECIES: HlyD family efflux transporter periplasmic adaptor subunit [Bacteria]MBJ7956030.1 HlyD family efflux transporter periplasmic adaptor subunit [Bacillus cereus]MBT0793326.1 HlyD family efflux transporter periplasmic adaptor subunit [Bacillus cereus]MCQ9615193.1 HlyD family secretion protein [Klebsiella pneumoniae]MDA4083996.1 HlyD family efflux transporter periplasmic adaptor subunit [Bacillus cereus]MDZ4454989.1 HlyD family efflux transporter periplasmic adaptor subunit [Bacill
MYKIHLFEELTDSAELLDRKPPSFVKWFLGFLGFCLFFGSLWAYLGKIDIVSKGTAIVQGGQDVSIIRTSLSGIVEELRVKSGDEIKKGDIIIQLKNEELMDKKKQLNLMINHIEIQKNMLLQLKSSIEKEANSFSENVDSKFLEEYKSYENGYKLLRTEKESEIKMLEQNKVSDETDEVLQGLFLEQEKTEQEIKMLEQNNDQNFLGSSKEEFDQRINLLKSQKINIGKRIEQRKSILDSENKKLLIQKKNKEEQNKIALDKYKQDNIVVINQRLEKMEEDLFLKKQEKDSLLSNEGNMSIRSSKDGIVQLSSLLQKGDLLEAGQEITSIIPKESNKKIKILLLADSRKGIKIGDKVNYSFNIDSENKLVGVVKYISAQPTFNKDMKSYVYEVDATVNTDKLDDLNVGIVGSASIVIGEESIWKFILKKLDFLS